LAETKVVPSISTDPANGDVVSHTLAATVAALVSLPVPLSVLPAPNRSRKSSAMVPWAVFPVIATVLSAPIWMPSEPRSKVSGLAETVVFSLPKETEISSDRRPCAAIN